MNFDDWMAKNMPAVGKGSIMWGLAAQAWEAGRASFAFDLTKETSKHKVLQDLYLVQTGEGEKAYFHSGAHSSATPKLYKRSNAKAASTYHKGSKIVPVTIILHKPE